MLYVRFCHMIKKKKERKDNGPNTALSLPHTSVYCLLGTGGAIPGERSLHLKTPDMKAWGTDFCLRLQKLKLMLYHNYL